MKPKREITLGEMQDECKRVFGGCALCRVKNECAFCLDVQPAEVDLTDPPRFTEAQMALLRAAKMAGFSTAYRGVYGLYFDGHGTVVDDFGLKDGEVLDLAELFGKEARNERKIINTRLRG